MKFNLKSKLLILLFLVMAVWNFLINYLGHSDTLQNYLYGASLGVLPFIGGLLGMKNAKSWGLFQSYIGKALFCLSLGFMTWGLGTLIFAYYNIFLQVSVPYPSAADALYILSWPLWVLGLFNLSKASGARYQLKGRLGRALLIVVPLLAATVSYYVLIIVAREGVIITGDSNLIKTFFDLAYPIGDVVILMGTLLLYSLSVKYLGGFFKLPITIILAGFLANYMGDFTFVYATTKGTYFVANWIDFIYTTAFFLLSLGVSLMDPHLFNKHSVE